MTQLSSFTMSLRRGITNIWSWKCAKEGTFSKLCFLEAGKWMKHGSVERFHFLHIHHGINWSRLTLIASWTKDFPSRFSAWCPDSQPIPHCHKGTFDKAHPVSFPRSLVSEINLRHKKLFITHFRVQFCKILTFICMNFTTLLGLCKCML